VKVYENSVNGYREQKLRRKNSERKRETENVKHFKGWQEDCGYMGVFFQEEAYDITLFESAEISLEDIEKKQRRKKSQREQFENELKKRVLVHRVVRWSIVGATFLGMIVMMLMGSAELTKLNQQLSTTDSRLEELKSLYIQTEMKVEAKYSSNTVEQKAQGELGMSRADSYQKEYISLEEGDKAEITEKATNNIFEILSDTIGDLWS